MVAKVGVTPTVGGVRSGSECRPAVRRLGPPPALRSMAAVLAATRSQGVDRMLPLGQSGRGTPCITRSEGCAVRAKGRQPRTGRRANWAPQAVRLPADVAPPLKTARPWKRV